MTRLEAAWPRTLLTSRGWHAGRGHSATRSATRALPRMTPVNSRGGDKKRGSDESGQRRTLDESESGYRWTCPYCGTSRTTASTGEDGEKNAMAALRAHVHASVGDGHGPRNSFPPEFLALSRHVVEVERRR